MHIGSITSSSNGEYTTELRIVSHLKYTLHTLLGFCIIMSLQAYTEKRKVHNVMHNSIKSDPFQLCHLICICLLNWPLVHYTVELPDSKGEETSGSGGSTNSTAIIASAVAVVVALSVRIPSL